MEEILKEILAGIGSMKNEIGSMKNELVELKAQMQDSQNSAVLFENRTMEEFGAIKHQMQIVIDYGKSMLKLHATTKSTLDDNIEEQTVLAMHINELEKRTSALEQMVG